MKHSRLLLNTVALCVAPWCAFAQSSDKPVYRCPGNPVLYTDALTPAQARAKGCHSIENTPLTVIPAPPPRDTQAETPARTRAKVDPAEQRARDSDARVILEAELSKEEERLEALKSEYKDGQPDRRGDERNYQKYLDRVAELKADIARTESDIAAIKRELGKLQRR
ncbi:MAG: hypothetical protein OEM00_09790 [Burkholderiaceae bacterium]|nr:hypothetical protein [Burkholderiaceae bacterium]MDH3461244.1 hypothetical protein [Burkholderiaceae bacterium]